MKNSVIVSFAALFGLLFLLPGIAPAGTVSYQYDALHRLTQVAYANGTTIAYAYDAAGNLKQKSIQAAMDSDMDGIDDGRDNCSEIPNYDQADFDGDGEGDVCDSDDDRADVDGNGFVDALTDGLLINRVLEGYVGDSLITGVVGEGCKRCSASAIASYVEQIRTGLDVDGNGKTDAATDGLLILRYMFGFKGAALTTGAVGNQCKRCNAEEVYDYCLMLEP